MRKELILCFVVIGSVYCESQFSDILSKVIPGIDRRIKRHANHSMDKSIRTAFDLSDSNHDGRVSADEMIGFIKMTTGMDLNEEAKGYLRTGFMTISGSDSINFQQYKMLYRAGLSQNGFFPSS